MRPNMMSPTRGATVAFFALLIALLVSAVLAQTWEIEVVDSQGEVGSDSSIDLDESGYLRISYHEAIDSVSFCRSRSAQEGGYHERQRS